MKIIDVGVCVNNVDPKGLGRIRYRPYGLFKSEIERSMTYEDWDDRDQFIALPFLPSHVNIIPQNRQSVKLIKYDTDKDTQNVEYVSGPFSTPHDFESQTFTLQHKYTTYGGVVVKDQPDVRDKNGKYIDKRSEGSIAKLNDNAINGNFGSDIIFTQNGLVLRGGKFITKETPDLKTRSKLQQIPLISPNMAKLMLKKFSQSLAITDDIVPIGGETVSKLKYIVEYEIDDLLNPTALTVFVYKVLNSENITTFDTNVFNDSTEINTTDTSLYKLINIDDGTTTTPTVLIPITSIKSACSEMRGFLYKIDQKNLSEVSPILIPSAEQYKGTWGYPTEDVHPFYFRLSKAFKIKGAKNDIEKENKNAFLNGVQLRTITGGKGLIFSKQSVQPPVSSTDKMTRILKVDNTKGDQSFAGLASDLIYLISSSTNKGSLDAINFNNLDPYEYTQENYLQDIHPNTYSFVRGEPLIKLLLLIYEVLIGHVHNINEPAIYREEKEKELADMINSMKIDLINQSIRIN